MSRIKRAFYLQVAGLGVAGICAFWASRHFPLLPMLARAQERVGAMNFWGAALYPFLFATGNILLLPGGVLAIGSGLFFGLWWGFFLNLVGSVIGAAVAFGISRKLARTWIERRFFKQRRWVVLDEAIARQGWQIIFLSQVHPLFPTSLLNYLYGITRIHLGSCLLWVALGQAPGLFLYAYLGTLTQLGLRLLRGQTHPSPVEYVVWIGGLALTFLVTAALGRVALRVLEEVEAAGDDAAIPKRAADEQAGGGESAPKTRFPATNF